MKQNHFLVTYLVKYKRVLGPEFTRMAVVYIIQQLHWHIRPFILIHVLNGVTLLKIMDTHTVDLIQYDLQPCATRVALDGNFCLVISLGVRENA
ncbi:MAG: hypothetical protein ABFD46_02340 [Armatimonadota bacterium]